MLPKITKLTMDIMTNVHNRGKYQEGILDRSSFSAIQLIAIIDKLTKMIKTLRKKEQQSVIPMSIRQDAKSMPTM